MRFLVQIHFYAVKVQRSLAPLSRFRGSHIPSAHEQQCCRFQSYANSVRSPMKFTSEIYIAWTTFLGSTTTDHELWRRTLTAYCGSCTVGQGTMSSLIGSPLLSVLGCFLDTSSGQVHDSLHLLHISLPGGLWSSPFSFPSGVLSKAAFWIWQLHCWARHYVLFL